MSNRFTLTVVEVMEQNRRGLFDPLSSANQVFRLVRSCSPIAFALTGMVCLI